MEEGPVLWDATPGVCCAAYQLGACEHTEADEQYEETPMTERIECTAVFPLVQRAQEFAARIQEPGWSAQDVVQKGRTVTWHAERTDHAEYLQDMLETVGYYGSDQRRKATLNGRPAPMSY